MCLISIAHKGSDKYNDDFLNALRNGAYRNTDGNGFAYKLAKTGAVFYEKGIISMEFLIDKLKKCKLKEEDELIVHSRTCTSGLNTSLYQHPFTLDHDMTRNMINRIGPTTTLHPVMFHNGTLTSFIGKTDTSDTYNFGNIFMRVPEIYKMFIEDIDKFNSMFSEVYKGSRFAFLSRQHDCKILGDGWITKDKYQFSNQSYISKNGIQNIITFEKKNNLTSHDILKNKNLPYELNLNIDKPLTINTIKINKSNFDEFILLVNKPTLNTISSFKNGEKFLIKKYDSNEGTYMLENLEHRSVYRIGITQKVIDEIFGLIPKKEYAKKYVDLINLHTTFNATKSSIKKVYNNFVTHVNRRHNKETMKVEQADKKLEVSVVSVLMYLKDYEFWINNDLKSLARKVGQEQIMVN